MYSDWWYEDNMADVMNNPPSTIWIGGDEPTVLRGNTVYIYADGDDKEHGPEDSSWNAEIEYKLNTSGTWSTAYINQSIWDSTTTPPHWRFTFEPPPTRPVPHHGPVDFQVRFMDPDGTWNDTWYPGNDLVHILNNIPEIQNMKGGHTDIYRKESTWIFVNATDVEEDKEDLTVEFYYDAPGGGKVWEQGYLSDTGEGQYDSSGGFFKVEFSPDESAGIGYYGFKVVITDTDGDYGEHEENALVNVMNNPPVPEDIFPSATKVGAGSGFIYIHVNATDIEDVESDLAMTVQWQYNETSPQGWSGAYITTEPYEGTAPNGWLKIKFIPDANMQLGRYDFRAKIEDTDGDESVDLEWIEISRAVEVQEIIPTIDDSAIGDSEVFRGQTAYIFLNASDTADWEHELEVSVQYHLIGNPGWIDITSSEIYYDDTNSDPNDDTGFWVIEFNPLKITALGLYEFQIRVKNSANGYSNDGDYTAITGTVNVKNNLPTASNLRVEGANTVDRGEEIYIFADAGDYENDPDDLIPFFEWSTDGSNWNDNYLNNEQKPSSGANTWRITFSPLASDTFSLGNYDFKVWFEDEDEDESNLVIVEDLVKVENVPPSAEDINVLSTQGYRGEAVTVYANAEDVDHDEQELSAIFQYKGPNDGDWTSYDDPGSYFEDDPVYLSGQWQIDFNASGDADLGQYSFRVQFSDGIESSTWEESLNVFKVENKDPVVEITSPDRGTQSSYTITCAAIVTDDNDIGLTWKWEFGDDETSEDNSPSHTYTESGSYTVKVTVTDIDGGQGENTVTINIPNGNDGPDTDGDGLPDNWEDTYFGNLNEGANDDPDNDGATNIQEYEAGTDPTDDEDTPPIPPKKDGESNMMLYLLLIIIIVVVVVLLLVFMLNKKKKKPEAGVPPSAPGIQQAPPEGPEAGVAPAIAAEPITEAPAAAAPMAAAPPKAAAKPQQIKCPKCGTGFAVESAERPITIECPNCHAKGTLT
jgi:PKD repeat protein